MSEPNLKNPLNQHPFDAGLAVEFDMCNVRPIFRRRQVGDVFLLEFEVDQETWELFRTARPELMFSCTVISDAAESVTLSPAATTQAPVAPIGTGRFWQQFHKLGLMHSARLKNALDLPEAAGAEQVWHKLHAVFQVDSMKWVEPQQFLAWADSRNIKSEFSGLVKYAATSDNRDHQ